MKVNMKNQFELNLNYRGKIICQRYFEDHNFKKDDVEFEIAINIIRSVTVMIKNHLKSETLKHLYSKYNSTSTNEDTSKTRDEDHITVVLLFNNRVVSTSIIQIDDFPARIRYSIDIRPIIPTLIAKIRKHLKKA